MASPSLVTLWSADLVTISKTCHSCALLFLKECAMGPPLGIVYEQYPCVTSFVRLPTYIVKAQ